jgi:hypothetical protein
MPTDVPFIALETVLGQDYTIRRGDMHAADDPLVKLHGRYFVRADATSSEIRRRQAELLEDSASAAYQHPPGPGPVKMRATRRIVVEIPASRTVEVTAGQEVMSDDEVFIASAGRGWEPATKPSRRGAKARA